MIGLGDEKMDFFFFHIVFAGWPGGGASEASAKQLWGLHEK